MNKYGKIIHKCSTIICLLLLIIGIARTLIMWNLLPDNIGVHFAGDGTFDVIVSKNNWLFIFYPYIVSAIIIFISEIIVYVLNKVKTGLKIGKEKEDKLRLMVEIFIDIFIKFIWVFFLSIIWSNSVITQNYLNITIANFLLYIQILAIIYLIVYIIIISFSKRK